MKRLFILALGAFLWTACNEEGKKENADTTHQDAASAKVEYFGDKITEEGAIPTDSLKVMMGDQKELKCKLSGPIQAVCQTKGCWMELKNADGTAMRVTFKDYAFFMPKDASGRLAIVDGIAKVEETSVADLREYAKDDGKSKEEIEAINQPETELVFEASGVILK
jgi:hypothetical protein